MDRFSGNNEPKSIIEQRGEVANDIFADQNANEVEEEPEQIPNNNNNNNANPNNGISFVTMVIILVFHLFIRFQFLYVLQLIADVLEKGIMYIASIVNQIHQAWMWP